jgi:hypothetical protein
MAGLAKNGLKAGSSPSATLRAGMEIKDKKKGKSEVRSQWSRRRCGQGWVGRSGWGW